MTKDTGIQVDGNLTDNFRGYAVLLRKIKQRVLIAQQQAIYAANEEMLRMYWEVGECCNKAKTLTVVGQENLATVGCGFEEQLCRDKRLFRTQYALHDAVLQ